eukprot:TRINITY_DN18777_c0_g1_i1.p1 TRINITY_DN18777_c0_g1~~TRINITY_DN18777_c0_g1_i1.p1  ORF type:complete len:166 (+),score=16.39 TRINITY_DN18777_c0_g1_i1:172-669(+)
MPNDQWTYEAIKHLTHFSASVHSHTADAIMHLMDSAASRENDIENSHTEFRHFMDSLILLANNCGESFLNLRKIADDAATMVQLPVTPFNVPVADIQDNPGAAEEEFVEACQKAQTSHNEENRKRPWRLVDSTNIMSPISGYSEIGKSTRLNSSHIPLSRMPSSA